VITGASSGIGRAMARSFGLEGARVGLLARNREALEHAAFEVEQLGGQAKVLPCDVADACAVERAAADVEDRWGGIDVWINNAMVSVFSPAIEMRAEEFERVTRVTYLGTVHGTLAALRRMKPRDKGVIIQIGSALAYRSIPLQSAYCACKAAIRGFTDSVRCELRHDRSRVRLSMLQLPAVNTPQFDVVKSRLPRHPQPVPPIYQPEVIARAAVYAARHKPREMWLAPSVLKAILGQRWIPRLVDRYLGRNGYDSQQTGRPADSERGDNLWWPLPHDLGAHGDFDSRARRHSTLLALRTHPWLTSGALAAGIVVLQRLARAA
jgi:NAD(P)-dependent dehydrogenase (short-subunit alcohol dehydrogenase family)